MERTNSPVAVAMLDKEAVRAEVLQDMIDYVDPDLFDRKCLQWAGFTVEALARRGIRALIQAGSCSWPFRSPSWVDDGVSSTHFSYMFNKAEARARLAQGLSPEMHAWAAIPLGRGIFIDWTTRYQPVQCQRILGIPWGAPPPPEYLWCGPEGIPDGVRYRPDPEATRYAVFEWESNRVKS
jgi:hypothetical protein